MTDTDRELSLQDEDRLPWLEAVDNDDEDEGISGSKLAGFVLAALLALGVVIGGVWWLRGQQQGPNGDGTMIAAEEGDYKVKPDDAGGMAVEGQGDSAFATSEGAEATGKVDMAAKPETPIIPAKPDKAAPAPKPAPVVAAAPKATTTVPVTGGKLEAKPPVAPVVRPAATAVAPASGGGQVQLGAYGSQAKAEQAWGELSAKYPYLASLPKSINPAAVGGNTVYRLRASAGGSAAQTCAKLKSAGANCIIVNN
jgi:SPOR domain